MKINVIVCEYNPLHNGHKYLIDMSKKAHPSCITVCIMSGNFVQRGEPAILDKWKRASWALSAGADIVIELPTFFALQSADKFAFGAMKIASLLNAEGYVSFGSENENVYMLKDIAEITLPNNEQFKKLLRANLSKNLPFAVSRKNAIIDCLKFKYDMLELENTIKSSNCILAIEYIKALIMLNSKLKPCALKRQSSSYNDIEIKGTFSSATSIRQAIKNSIDFNDTVPDFVYKSLKENLLPSRDVFESMILYKLRAMPNEELAKILDVNEGLENLIKKAVDAYSTLPEIISHATNKRYTASRIRRICYSALLDITKQDYLKYNEISSPLYARVLGFKETAKPLLKHIKENSDIKLITSVKDALEDENVSSLLELDLKATDVYTLALYGKDSVAKRDFTEKIIII